MYTKDVGPEDVGPAPKLLEPASLTSLDTLEPFSLLGVRVSYLDTFIKQCGGRQKLKGLTTTDTCNMFVKPLTEPSRQSLCSDLLKAGSPAVGRATWFISHAWAYEFLGKNCLSSDVVDAIQYHFHEANIADVFLQYVKDKTAPDPVVWFDLFSNSQHDTSVKPYTWWSGTFTNAIKELGNVLMILHPWNDPVTITRAWCVFELLACKITNSHFDVVVPPRHRPAFRESLRDDPGQFHRMLMAINTKDSRAFKPEDRLAIHRAVKEWSDGEFNVMDRMVFKALNDWMVVELGTYIMETEHAGDELEHVAWLLTLADLWADQGEHDKAEEPLLKSLDKLTALLGSEHVGTIQCVHRLGNVYASLGRYAEAEHLLLRAYYGANWIFGEDGRGAILIAKSLAEFYGSVGKDDKAEPLLLLIVERARRILGEDDPVTIGAVGDLASLYDRQGKYDEAEKLALDCLERGRRVLGEDHPDLLGGAANLAGIYLEQEKFDLAATMFMDCMNKMTRLFGGNHPDVIGVRTSLASVFGRKGEYDKAETLYKFNLRKAKKELGADHPVTIANLSSLGLMYREQEKLDLAEPFLVELWEARKRTLGAEHEDTITVAEMLEELRELREGPAPQEGEEEKTGRIASVAGAASSEKEGNDAGFVKDEANTGQGNEDFATGQLTNKRAKSGFWETWFGCLTGGRNAN
ncbi:Kinesin light chain 3 [Borealophlyctis nickersoniae]|nr:Kinesin light chain 3 [Borealophlyctis nickersoniae]